MNPPRPGKNLLVLDLDYSTYPLVSKADLSSCGYQTTFRWIAPRYRVRPTRDARVPGSVCQLSVHGADGSVYRDYDIVIWSQTHWRWLETKLVELGILGGVANYKICFVLDSLPMFPVRSPLKA
jgi:ubiquitin-like domain-containing CTD phosphatase 1